MHPLIYSPCRPSALPRRVMSVLGASLLTALAAMTSMHAQAADARHWPDTYLGRLQAQALIQTANADILGSNSATLTLEKWCRDHRLAANPVVVATLMPGGAKPITPEQRERLQIGPDEPVKYRRVQLSCGALVLSEADNWYVPSRLSDDMNRLLDTTDTPFGKAVLGLKPFRRTYSAKLLWSPLPPLWEMLPARPQAGAQPASAKTAPAALILPDALFEHRALVFAQDLRPIAEVIETYQKGLLAFPPPPQ